MLKTTLLKLSIITFVVLLLLGGFVLLSTFISGNDISSPITNAMYGPSVQQNLNWKSYPFMMWVETFDLNRGGGSWIHIGCAASAVSPDTIVTAAHCIWAKTNNLYVKRINEKMRVTTSDGRVYNVTKKLFVDNYNGDINDSYQYNDLVLLKIDGSLNSNSYLPVGNISNINIYGSAYSWQGGAANESPKEYNNSNLKSINLLVDELQEPNRYLVIANGVVTTLTPNNIKSQTFRATRSGFVSISGDSGSPFVINGKIVGTLSFGYANGMRFTKAFDLYNKIENSYKASLQSSCTSEVRNICSNTNTLVKQEKKVINNSCQWVNTVTTICNCQNNTCQISTPTSQKTFSINVGVTKESDNVYPAARKVKSTISKSLFTTTPYQIQFILTDGDLPLSNGNKAISVLYPLNPTFRILSKTYSNSYYIYNQVNNLNYGWQEGDLNSNQILYDNNNNIRIKPISFTQDNNNYYFEFNYEMKMASRLRDKNLNLYVYSEGTNNTRNNLSIPYSFSTCSGCYGYKYNYLGQVNWVTGINILRNL